MELLVTEIQYLVQHPLRSIKPGVFDGIFTINSLRIVLKSVGYFLSDLRLLHTFVAGGVPFIQQGSMGGWRQDYWLPKSNHQQNREQLSSI